MYNDKAGNSSGCTLLPMPYLLNTDANKADNAEAASKDGQRTTLTIWMSLYHSCEITHDDIELNMNAKCQI